MVCFPNYFADANAGFRDARYVLFGVPYDKTSSFRYGAKKAPFEIRQASWNFESFHLHTKTDLTMIPIHDHGDLQVEEKKPEEMLKIVQGFVQKIVINDKFPVAIGGEHSFTPGVVRAVTERYNDVGVLFLDAHLDFREVYENELFNHACALKRVADIVNVENIVTLGTRSAEKKEYEEAEQEKLLFIDAFTINSYGIKDAIKKCKERLNDKRIYISLDVDVIDPAYAPGVSTPEPLGLTPFDVLECIEAFASQTVGLDVVEVCPPFDKGETALLAAKIIRFAIDEFWRNNP